MTKLIEERVRKIKPTYKILLYVGMGILWSLANVGYSFGFLTWFALVPLLFLLRFETLQNASLYSTLFGFVFYLTNLYWMAVPFVKFFGQSGNIPLVIIGAILGMLTVILLSAWHGLSYAAAVFLSKYATLKKSEFFYIVFALIMTASDYFFPKIWHDQIGYSQYIFLGFCQIADIFGVPFITLIILACNVSVLMIIEAFLLHKPMHIPVVTFLCMTAVVIVTIIYGNMRLDQLDTLAADAPTAKVAVIQGNYSGIDKKDRSKRSEMTSTYNRLSMSTLDQSPDLIIWPESSVTSQLSSDLEYYDSIMTFRGVPLIFGTQVVTQHTSYGKSDNIMYNSLIMLDANAKPVSRYDKMRLIPFAESIPLPGLGYIMNWYGLMPFTEGHHHTMMETDILRIAPNICYEDLMPDLIRGSMHKRDGGQRVKANMIVNATNDSWFGATTAPLIHLHISAFRAIENRCSVVRAACTGCSMICSPTGHISKYTILDTQDTLVSDVILFDSDTIYETGGWIFVYIILLISLALPAIVFIIRSHRQMMLQKRLKERHHQEKLYQTWLD